MQGKVVLITGGAKRVGAAICRRLHAAGARLMLHYRASAGEARLLQAELNHQRANSVALIQADLLDLGKLPSLVEQTVQTFGKLDALVNNASTFFPTPVGEISGRGLGRPDRHQSAGAAVPLAGRGAGAAEDAGRDRQHHRHPCRASAQELRRLLGRQGRTGRTDALARARAGARSARQRRRAGPDPVARRRVVRRAVAAADHFAHAAEARRHARRHRQGRALPACRGAPTSPARRSTSTAGGTSRCKRWSVDRASTASDRTTSDTWMSIGVPVPHPRAATRAASRSR